MEDEGMSEAKGPWMTDGNVVKDAEGFEVAYCTSGAGGWASADARAAHIVACVNGAEAARVDRNALRETHMLYSALEARADALAAENERLRGALNALDAFYLANEISLTSAFAPSMRTWFGSVISRARAALAGKGE